MAHLKKVTGLLCALIVFAGCASAPGDSERSREVVLKYLNADVGTTGPFSKHQTKELDVLSSVDRPQALALLERGAVGFVIFAGSSSGEAGAETRIVLVSGEKIVGDFRAAKK